VSRPLALLLLLCIACGGREKATTPAAAPPPSADAPHDGGRLVRRLDVDLVTMNPVVSSSRGDRYVVQYLFTPLIRLDRQLQPVAGLADSWEVSPDGLVYRFRLNQKATHSDGRPVRANDVVFTLGKIVDPSSEAIQFSGAFEQLDMSKTRAIDDHTVEVVFRRVKAQQLVHFTDVLVLPEHVYSKGNFRDDFNEQAVGSGPYRLVRREAGKEVVLERRSDYWGPKPPIRTVVFKVITDQSVAFNALKRGEIDEAMLTSDTWARERANPALTNQIDLRRFYLLNYNFLAWNNRHPLFKEKEVRRAMSMCMPVEAVIRDLYHGTARAMTGPFTPDEWAYNPSVPVIRYDPAEALRLLQGAGWGDSDNDGVLDRQGRPFRFSLIIMSGGTGHQLAQMLQAELKKIGVQLEISLMDGAMAIEKLMGGNFEAGYLSWDLDVDPDPYPLFHSTQTYPRGQNFVGYANAEVDKLLEQGRVELDQAKRKEIYWRVHQLLAEDQPYTWVIQVSQKWGVNRRVRGVDASPGFGFFLWYPGELEWWIAPGK
jgi:peptide/nickel transport system substrate-binding protein